MKWLIRSKIIQLKSSADLPSISQTCSNPLPNYPKFYFECFRKIGGGGGGGGEERCRSDFSLLTMFTSLLKTYTISATFDFLFVNTLIWTNLKFCHMRKIQSVLDQWHNPWYIQTKGSCKWHIKCCWMMISVFDSVEKTLWKKQEMQVTMSFP